MWLLDVETLELNEFFGRSIPAYAILSHTWGPEEVSFVEMKKPKYREVAQSKAGFSKIKGCCDQAKRDGLAWAWVDSCCIDKRSSAQLSEAINSMFRWYGESSRCYVYLADVPSGSEAMPMLEKSKWFTRGWTLQELLAPRRAIFFAQDWIPIGHQTSYRVALNTMECGADEGHIFNLTDKLSAITGIPVDFLVQRKGLEHACVAQRMFWASRRETTREEDRAYSLLGLFDISIPILYGEGLEKAFTRLQREIMTKTTDQSILAWHRSDELSYRLLAESPDCFRNSGMVVQLGRSGQTTSTTPVNWTSFSMTNLGLRISLPLMIPKANQEFEYGDCATAVLDSRTEDGLGNLRNISLRLIFLNLDVEGMPVFMCDRVREFTFGSLGQLPKSIFLCGIDYKRVPAKVGFAEPCHIDNNDNEVSHKQDLRAVETSDDGMDYVARIFEIISDEMDVSQTMFAHEMNLVDIGIDSLSWIIIVSRIREEMDVDVGIGSLYAFPTFADFKDYLVAELLYYKFG